MTVSLGREDFESISEIVREQLQKLMPDNEFIKTDSLIFGPEFMAEPLRISTPSTHFDFDPVHEVYITKIREEIQASDLTPEEKSKKQLQLESIILFGQLLFSQSASLHFLKNPLEDKSEEVISPINLKMEQLRALVENEGIQYNSSKLEALTRRKAFNDSLNELKKTINDSALEADEKKQLLGNLGKAKDFYYQANDLNFKYANKPSRSFSNFVNNCERYGSKIALTASIIAIGATALSLIPCLAPVMVPIALVATTISMVIGLPLALKNVGTMIYNLIRFEAAPTPGELINAALLGTSLLLAGVGGVVAQAVNSGALSATANLITKAVTTVDDIAKTSIGLAGHALQETKLDQVEFYKSELDRLRPKEQNLDPNNSHDEEKPQPDSGLPTLS